MFLAQSMEDLPSVQKADADPEFEVRIRRKVAAEAEAKPKTMEKEAAKLGAAARGFDRATRPTRASEIYGPE